MCQVTGTNTQGVSTCVSLGITFNRRAGKLSFANTPLYPYGGFSNNVATKIIGLTLSFAPY